MMVGYTQADGLARRVAPRAALPLLASRMKVYGPGVTDFSNR